MHHHRTTEKQHHQNAHNLRLVIGEGSALFYDKYCLKSQMSDHLSYSSNHFNTRHALKGCFSLPVSTSNAWQHTVMFKGMKIWNGLPSNIKHLTNKTYFKKSLKKYLMEQFTSPSTNGTCFAT